MSRELLTAILLEAAYQHQEQPWSRQNWYDWVGRDLVAAVRLSSWTGVGLGEAYVLLQILGPSENVLAPRFDQ